MLSLRNSMYTSVVAVLAAAMLTSELAEGVVHKIEAVLGALAWNFLDIHDEGHASTNATAQVLSVWINPPPPHLHPFRQRLQIHRLHGPTQA